MRWLSRFVVAVILVALTAPPAAAVVVNQQWVDRSGSPIGTAGSVKMFFTNVSTGRRASTYLDTQGRSRLNLRNGAYRITVYNQGHHLGSWNACIVNNGRFLCGNAIEPGQDASQFFPPGVIVNGGQVPRINYTSSGPPVGCNGNNCNWPPFMGPGATSWDSGMQLRRTTNGFNFNMDGNHVCPPGGPCSLPLEPDSPFILFPGDVGVEQQGND